jgi:tRNA pseudouridine55 synthase
MDGVIIINKDKGMTSFDVVKEIRKLTHVRRVGHSGTLDPAARGVLPVCIGKATKIVRFLMEGDKEYEAEMTLGITTDTQDAEGKILEEREVSVKREELEEILKQFMGEIEQIPPMVSAIHYKGKRLYELARQGIVVERNPRKVHIHNIKMLNFEDGPHPKAFICVTCSKGTYIRTLCSDIGERLGCGAHQSALIRTRSGSFTLEHAKTLKEIYILKDQGKLNEAILPIAKVMQTIRRTP